MISALLGSIFNSRSTKLLPQMIHTRTSKARSLYRDLELYEELNTHVIAFIKLMACVALVSSIYIRVEELYARSLGSSRHIAAKHKGGDNIKSVYALKSASVWPISALDARARVSVYIRERRSSLAQRGCVTSCTAA